MAGTSDLPSIVELIERQKQWPPTSTAQLLNEYPDLPMATRLALVYHEFKRRREVGLERHLEEYASQFPQLAAEFSKLLAVWRVTQEQGPPLSFHTRNDVRLLGTIGDAIGQGGMGIVYEAESQGRRVAVKVINPFANRHEQHQFDLEFSICNSLEHPNIVKMFRSGIDDQQRLCFSMELLDGPPLHQLAKDNPLLAARMLAKVCDGLHHAHQEGVIHQDIKCSNILLRSADNPEPVIVDFGLARCSMERNSRLQRGRLFGTPAYMSPEQTRGRKATVSSDLYSLGVVLYRTLTGRLPFDPDQPYDALFREIRTAGPMPPRKLNSKIPRWLEEVCLRCLAKDPRQRYSSAAELAAALHGPATASEPCPDEPSGAESDADSSAAKPSPAAQVRDEPIRQPRQWLYAAAASAAMLCVAGMSAWQSETEGPDTVQTAAVSPSHPPSGAFNRCRDWSVIRVVRRHSGPIVHLSFTAHGDQLLAASEDGTASVTELDSPDMPSLTGHDKAVVWGAEVPGKPFWLTTADDRTARIWPKHGSSDLLASGRLLTNHSALCAAVSPDGEWAAVGGTDGLVRLVRIGEAPEDEHHWERTLAPPRRQQSSVRLLTWSADGGLLAAAMGDFRVRVWDVFETKERVARPHRDELFHLEFLDERMLVTASRDGHFALTELAGNRPAVEQPWTRRPVLSVACSADGRTVAAGRDDGSILLYERDGEQDTVLRGHRAEVTGVGFSPDGAVLYSIEHDSRCIAWSLDPPQRRSVCRFPEPTAIAVSPASGRVAIGCRNGSVHLLPSLSGAF